jgi:hypothetical protein
MEKKQTFRRIFLVPLIFIFITILFYIPYKQALVFHFQNTNNVLAYIPFTEETTFKIKYTHSIHLSDVVETYHGTADNQIQLDELMYEDFAIGMPSNAEIGEVFEERDGKYYIKNMKRIFPFFDLRIGQVKANHTIIYNGQDYQLSDYVEKGTWVRIQIKKLSVLQQLKGVNIIES